MTSRPRWQRGRAPSAGGQGALRALLGRAEKTMLRDEARSFLRGRRPHRGRPTWCCACCGLRSPRSAPGQHDRRKHDPRGRGPRSVPGRRRLARPSGDRCTSSPTCQRRQLPALRAHLPRAPWSRPWRRYRQRWRRRMRRAAVLTAGAAAAGRLLAEPRGLKQRTHQPTASLMEFLAGVKDELGLIDHDIDERYFTIAGIAPVGLLSDRAGVSLWRCTISRCRIPGRGHVRRAGGGRASIPDTRLRVKPAANGRQRVDEFNVRLTPEARLHRHDRLLRHRGGGV